MHLFPFVTRHLFPSFTPPFVPICHMPCDPSFQMFREGLHAIRALFPRAKFILHLRRNLTRTLHSDFWRRTEADRQRTLGNFGALVRRFEAYQGAHPKHAYGTTIEDLTDPKNTTQLEVP